MSPVAVADPRAKRYERTKLTADLLLWTVEIALLIALVFSGLGLSLRVWLEQYSHGSPALLAALYLVALGIGDEAIFFWPRWWRSYRLSKDYGLSVQNFWGWLWDYIKEKILSGIFVLFIVEMFFWLMRSWPSAWWVISGVTLSLLMMLLAQIAPLIIFPLFYKFKPLEDEELRARLSSLAERAGVRLERIDEVNLSSKTRAANAALAGLGHTRRIILGDTLLRSFPNDEIETVIAHELGHYVGGHLWQRMAAQVVTIFLFLGLIDWIVGALAVPLGFWGISDPAALPLMALVSSLAAFVVLPPHERPHARHGTLRRPLCRQDHRQTLGHDRHA